MGKKRQCIVAKGDIFTDIHTQNTPPPSFVDDLLNRDNGIVGSRSIVEEHHDKRKRGARTIVVLPPRGTSSLFLFATGCCRREGRACFGREEALSFCARGIGIPKTLFCCATNGEESYEFKVAPRKVAETTRRAHASTSKSASRQKQHLL